MKIDLMFYRDTVILVKYHRLMYAVKYSMWYWWHCRLRDTFDLGFLRKPTRWLARKVYKVGNERRMLLSFKLSDQADKFGYGFNTDSRPFYHMCCNGNAGGWRTSLCDWLENYQTGYRYHEDKLYELEGIER